MKLGNGTVIEGKIEIDSDGKISIGGEYTRIRKWCCFKPYDGYIDIGNHCSINSFSHFSGNGRIKIGNNVLIATQCVLVSANHNFDNLDIPINQQGETRAPIIIKDCWLGEGVKVLAGVTIGEGNVIGAGSVVTKDIPDYSVAVGVPAKVLYDRRSRA